MHQHRVQASPSRLWTSLLCTVSRQDAENEAKVIARCVEHRRFYVPIDVRMSITRFSQMLTRI